MLYKVKEISELTGVTIKTLYYYHKIGLLKPCKISDAGYRLYGEKELERLQQILFYRELDFSLKDIKKTLENEPSRIMCLIKQQKLLFARRQRLDVLLETIDSSINLVKKGETMNKEEMFKGLNVDEWENALLEHNNYIKDNYGYEIPKIKYKNLENMNESAKEAQRFIEYLATALKSGWKASDKRLQKVLKDHIEFLNNHSMNINSKLFVKQARFFLEDDFHRDVLEKQQIGLSYYLYTIAEMYAELN